MLEADALMRLLVPDGKVLEVAGALSLSASLIYQERRPVGQSHAHTGTRNSIARLDTIAELALSHTPEAVKLLGKRYTDIYSNSLGFPPQTASEPKLIEVLARTTREVGEAMSALISHASIDECAVEVEQAQMWMDRALKMIQALKEKDNVSQ